MASWTLPHLTSFMRKRDNSRMTRHGTYVNTECSTVPPKAGWLTSIYGFIPSLTACTVLSYLCGPTMTVFSCRVCCLDLNFRGCNCSIVCKQVFGAVKYTMYIEAHVHCTHASFMYMYKVYYSLYMYTAQCFNGYTYTTMHVVLYSIKLYDAQCTCTCTYTCMH